MCCQVHCTARDNLSFQCCPPASLFWLPRPPSPLSPNLFPFLPPSILNPRTHRFSPTLAPSFLGFCLFRTQTDLPRSRICKRSTARAEGRAGAWRQTRGRVQQEHQGSPRASSREKSRRGRCAVPPLPSSLPAFRPCSPLCPALTESSDLCWGACVRACAALTLRGAGAWRGAAGMHLCGALSPRLIDIFCHMRELKVRRAASSHQHQHPILALPA